MSRNEALEHVLLRVIVNNELSEQSQIQEKLQESGIDLPQSTLSRWLKKLNIVKINNRYQVASHEALMRIPVFSVKASKPNLIVLHTLPGHGNSLAIQIDQKTPKENASSDISDPYNGVLGTIAGDDTVLVIMQNELALLAFKIFLEKNMDSFYILFE